MDNTTENTTQSYREPGINKFLYGCYLPVSAIWLIYKAIIWLNGSVIVTFYGADEYLAKRCYEVSRIATFSIVFFAMYVIMAIVCVIAAKKIYCIEFNNVDLISVAVGAVGACELIEVAMLVITRFFTKEHRLFYTFQQLDLEYKIPIAIAAFGYAVGFALQYCFKKKNGFTK